MRCVSCGSDNPEDKKFCGMCGQSLIVSAGGGVGGVGPGQMQYRYVQPVAVWPDAASSRNLALLCRLLGGMAWLFVSFGTFLIAFGWLETLDVSYFDDPMSSLRMIGYGVIVLAISAIFFAVRDFIRNPR